MAGRYAVSLADDVRDVLQRSTITPTTLALPGQLDRKLYERVAKVIEAAGGKWNRKAQAHLFPRDPREVLGLALVQGHIVDAKKANQQFFTPPDLAVRVAQAADVQPGHLVLEPSAGEGALAEAAEAAGGRVHCIEIDPALVETLRAKGYQTKGLNFLHVRPDESLQYDRVVMNPPFTKGAAVAHILHAYRFLRAGGRLAAIADAGVRFRTTKADTAFRAFVQEQGGSIAPLPDDSFVDAGTAVSTVLVVIPR